LFSAVGESATADFKLFVFRLFKELLAKTAHDIDTEIIATADSFSVLNTFMFNDFPVYT